MKTQSMILVFVLLLATALSTAPLACGDDDDDGSDDDSDDDNDTTDDDDDTTDDDDDTTDDDDDTGDDDTTDDDDDDATVAEFEELFLSNCLITEEGEYVIRTRDQWDDFVGNTFDDKGITIDFNSQMVIGVVASAGGCAAYGTILDIVVDEEQITFSYAAEGDGPCFCDIMLPIFAVVEQSELPVLFVNPEKGGRKGSLDYVPLFMNNCNIFEDGEFVIRTQSEWETFIGYLDKEKIGIAIDFDTQMVIGVIAGAGGCITFGQIVSIVQDASKITFEYTLDSDGYCECIVLGSLFAIVAESALPVEFIGPSM